MGDTIERNLSMRNIRAWIVLPIFVMLHGCGGQEGWNASNLTGQVTSLAGSSKVNHYAASRFLEHAAMGPSPSSVAQVKALGLDAWLSQQYQLPATKIFTPPSIIEYDLNLDKAAGQRFDEHHKVSTYNFFIGSDDQLRVKTSWVLSNFLVVSTRKIQLFGALEYWNLLQTHAFGQYGDLLKAISRSPAMGHYLDNSQNRRWQLNENYGRELMQLFSVGLVQLNLNGSLKKDAAGKSIETYSQKDVIEATRALTGWDFADPNVRRMGSNFANHAKPMEANFADQHDTGSKTVLGRTIPAGQDAAKDLDSLIEILVTHPNTAPFVSLRLIQGMTTSDPSPAYLERVATVFRDTKGNMQKVISAILMDPEARYGDVPGKSTKGFGRIKEPFLMTMHVMRGLGCRAAIRRSGNPSDIWQNTNQQPLQAYTVFNFYPPNHRTQGTNILAPEQKMLNSNEFSTRMWRISDGMRDETVLSNAGCDTTAIKNAVADSDDKLIELLSERFFRGAMPATLAKSLIEANGTNWLRERPFEMAGAMLDMATLTPAFGVSK
jgi:uncharacterized protein (DUF1800 family)